MSGLIINGDSSGSITLMAPAVAGTNTVTLPANTGTVITTGTNTRSIPAAAVPTGSVLQVAWTNWTGAYVGASASNVDFSGFSATFTPLYATSKVAIFVSAGVNLICDGVIYLKRNGTIVKDTWFASDRNDNPYDFPQASQSFLDSPNTTSTITYQIGGRAPGCSNIIRFGASDNSSSIMLMEIAG